MTPDLPRLGPLFVPSQRGVRDVSPPLIFTIEAWPSICLWHVSTLCKATCDVHLKCHARPA